METVVSNKVDAEADMWSAGWTSGMYSKDMFILTCLPTWGLNFCIKPGIPDDEMDKAANTWGYMQAPIPIQNGGTWYGMYSKSKNKDAAWEFVKYWTGEECNKARIGMELPVLNSVVESEGIMNEDKFAPFYKMLEQSDGHTPASFIIEDWSEISENLSLSFEQLFNPSAYMDVKEVLKEAAEAQ